LSSAILYLAIVAIWACVLVPRWLHRSHDAAAEEQLSGEEVSSSLEEAMDRPEAYGSEELADAGELGDHGGESATLREQVVGAEARGGPEDHAAPADPAEEDEEAEEEEAEEEEESITSARFTSVSYSVTEVSVSAAGSGGHEAVTAPESAPHAGTAPTAGNDRRPPSRSRPRDPAAGHTRVLRARRRMLTMLVTLAIAVAGSTVVGLTAWWAVIPPAGLLGVYLLLLREVAHADAEIARRRAEAHARAVSAARERARLARTPAPQPTAEIIDISALALQAGDQPYDQYADAEIRAVGD
jgi:hypothetical protein